MPSNPKGYRAKLDTLIAAWENEAPGDSFGGMTLAQFQAVVKPSYDARKKIDQGDQLIKDGTNERDDADVVSNAKIQLVVNAVKGDPNHGENSDLYEAMGYKRKSERKSGLTRKTKIPPKP
jgi:hypothetical protein